MTDPTPKSLGGLAHELAHEMRKHFGQPFSTQEAVYLAVRDALKEIRKLNEQEKQP